MGTFALFLVGAIGAILAASILIQALIFVLRPLLVRLLPDFMFGPGGMYIDTLTGEGIFDVRWRARRA